MKRLSVACTGLWLLLTFAVNAGTRPATIQEFYDAVGRTRVIAHRGFSGAAPENTIAAVRLAIQAHADMVEIDVTLTADDHIVVIHDDTLDRTTNGSGEVARFTLADLQQLDAGSWFSSRFAGERIPTLDHVLDEVNGLILLNIEIKSEAVTRGIVNKVSAAIREHDMGDQVVVSSFSPMALQKMHTVAPEILTAVLYNTTYHRGQDAVAIVTKLGAFAFNIKRQQLTRKMYRRCRNHGVPVGVYTVNEPSRMRRLVRMHVGAIFTDYPDRLVKVLSSLSPPEAALEPTAVLVQP